MSELKTYLASFHFATENPKQSSLGIFDNGEILAKISGIIKSDKHKEVFEKKEDILSLDNSLEDLFYNEEKIAELDVFGGESRIGFEKYKGKIGKDISLEEKYIRSILEGMLLNVGKIYKRQEFITYLLAENRLEELLGLYGKGFFLEKYSLLKEGKTMYKFDGKKNEIDTKYTGKILISELFKEFEIENILSIMNSEEEILSLRKEKFHSKLRLPEYMIINLYDFRKSINSIIEFKNFLKQNYSDNEIIKSKIKLFDSFINEFNLDKDFENILLYMKSDENHLIYLSNKADKILEEGIRLGAILKIANFINTFELNKITFDQNKEQYYKGGYSVFSNLKNNVKADSLNDNPLNIFRAPNGIGKSFYIEKDIYIRIFAQSIGFSTVEEGNFRIYEKIISANRMQSQSENDYDLSALGMEGQKLDEIYEQIENTSGNILLTLDETGSTTDEKNQFKIIKDFIESIKKLEKNRIIRINLSTHNQLLIDYFKEDKNINIGFYTFDDERNLREGERDSDTFNSFKRLLGKLNDGEQVEIGEDLLHNLESFLAGNIKNYKILNPEENISYKPLEFREQEIEYMSEHVKGFAKTLYTFLKKDTYIRNNGICKRANMSNFIGENGEEYEYFPMYFSNSNFQIQSYKKEHLRGKLSNILNQTHISDIRIVRERQRLILKFKDKIGESLENFEYSINEISKHLELVQNILNGDLYFLESDKIAWDRKGRKVYIDNNSRLHYPYETRQNNIVLNMYNHILNKNIDNCSYFETLSIKEILENLIGFSGIVFSENVDFSDLHYKHNQITSTVDFINLIKHELEQIFEKLDVLLNILSIDFYGILKKSLFYIRKPKEESINLYEFYNKIITGDESSIDDRDLGRFLYEILSLLEREILGKINQKQNTIEDFLSGKYSLPKTEKTYDEISNDYTYAFGEHFYILRDLVDFSEKKVDIFSEFIETTDKIISNEDLLLKQLQNYFVEKLKFILGNNETNISNIDGLIHYLRKFHTIALDNVDEDNLTIGNNSYLGGDDDIYENFVNNDFPSINSSYSVKADFENLFGLTEYAKFVKEHNLVDVCFTQEKKIDIKNMKGENIEDKNYIGNDVYLDFENPIEIINGFNSSGKTEYIRNILLTINSALNYGFVNADSMTIGGIHKFAYIDRIVAGNNDYSSGEQDLLYWLKLFKEVEDKDFVIVNVDEIFTTMDMKYSTVFAYNFVGKLLEMGKFAIVISHNHEFVDLISKLKGVKVNRFDSKIDKNGDVKHNYKKTPGAIKDSAGVQVLKSIGIGNKWLNI